MIVALAFTQLFLDDAVVLQSMRKTPGTGFLKDATLSMIQDKFLNIVVPFLIATAKVRANV